MATPKRTGIIGTSGFGKSFLADHIVAEISKTKETIGFHALAKKMNVTRQAVSMMELLKWAKSGRGKTIVIDECGEPNCLGTGKLATKYRYFATGSRNEDHNVLFIMQRGVMLSKSMRDQLTEIYLFNVDAEDAKEWALKFNCPQLEKAYLLPKRVFYYTKRGGVGFKRGTLKV